MSQQIIQLTIQEFIAANYEEDFVIEGLDETVIQALMTAYDLEREEVEIAIVDVIEAIDELDEDEDDYLWRSEQAMQRGMVFGTQGYNEVMGYDEGNVNYGNCPECGGNGWTCC